MKGPAGVAGFAARRACLPFGVAVQNTHIKNVNIHISRFDPRTNTHNLCAKMALKMDPSAARSHAIHESSRSITLQPTCPHTLRPSRHNMHQQPHALGGRTRHRVSDSTAPLVSQ
jgi:hypothetical protein